MKHRIAARAASVVSLIAVLTTAAPRAATADLAVPAVPSNLVVPSGQTPFLIGHARGTQNYVCVLGVSGFAWTFVGPQATLFDEAGHQLITHFLSANPIEAGTLRATWQHSGDSSTVWAAAVASSSDPNYVAPGAIPWLLLRVVGAQYGPGFGDDMIGTAYLHRVNTAGGAAPSTGCGVAADVGKKAWVPYATDYIFYRP